jgi:hypothetical protein
MAKAERERKLADLKKFGATFKVSPSDPYHPSAKRKSHVLTAYLLAHIAIDSWGQAG